MATMKINNHEVLVDAKDVEFLRSFKWRLVKGRGAGPYVVTSIGGQLIRMHRLLLNAPKDKQVDHINRNTAEIEFEIKKEKYMKAAGESINKSLDEMLLSAMPRFADKSTQKGKTD